MDTQKLEDIHQSFDDGLFGDMSDHIREYGIIEFYVDFMEYLLGFVSDYEPVASALYGEVVHTYHKIHQ